MKKTILVYLLVTVLVSSGCTMAKIGSGEINDLGRYLSLKNGESTKADVYKAFGQPYDVQDKGLTWFYYKVDIKMNSATLVPFVGLLAGGNDYDVMITRMQFNSDRLSGIETEQQNYYVNMWVGMTGNDGSPRWSTPEVKERVKAEMVAQGLPYDEHVNEKWRK